MVRLFASFGGQAVDPLVGFLILALSPLARYEVLGAVRAEPVSRSEAPPNDRPAPCFLKFEPPSVLHARPLSPVSRVPKRSRSDEPEELHDWYARRGEAESWIKDFKRALKADRLSCYRFFANQFRLLLHAAAYWLLDASGRKLVEAGVRRMQLDTLRLLLVEIGGRVRQLLTKVRLHLASGHPSQHLSGTIRSLLLRRSDTLPDQVCSTLHTSEQYRTCAQCHSIPPNFDQTFLLNADPVRK